jgi:hypothetical protein
MAEFKRAQVEALEADIGLVDARKGQVPARSLEGLLKVKLAILDKILLLKGEATSRSEQLVVSFRSEKRETSHFGASAEVAKGRVIEGEAEDETGGKRGLIEKRREKDAVGASGNPGAVAPARVGGAGQRALPGSEAGVMAPAAPPTPIKAEEDERAREVRRRITAPDPSEESRTGQAYVDEDRAKVAALVSEAEAKRDVIVLPTMRGALSRERQRKEAAKRARGEAAER